MDKGAKGQRDKGTKEQRNKGKEYPKLYVFKNLKKKGKFQFKKKVWQCLKFGVQWGKFGQYAIWDAIYTFFQTFESLEQKFFLGKLF